MKLTRRALVGGAAGAALAGTGIYELVDQLTPAPTRALPAGRGAARAAHPPGPPHRLERRGRRACAAAAPPGHDREASARRGSVRARRCARGARADAGEAGRPVSLDARRARRDGRLGAAVLPALRPRPGRAPPAARPPSDRRSRQARARARGRDPLPERPRRRRPRGRTTSPSCSAATRSSTFQEAPRRSSATAAVSSS